MAQGMEFVEYVTDQVDDSCKLTHRMMFGGCTLYLDGKVLVLESRRARGVEKGKTAR